MKMPRGEDGTYLRKESTRFLSFFLCFTLIQALAAVQMGEAQTEETEDSVPILFMTFSGANTEEAARLGSAMRTELEWISRTSGYTVKQSKSTLRTQPAISKLSSADRAHNPQYLVNGIITREGGVSVAEVSLWNLEGPALLFSQALEYRRLDEALANMPFFTWSLYSILPVPETPVEKLQAARAEAEAAKAEAEIARAEAESAKAALENGGGGAASDNAATRAWKSRWVYLGLRGGISPRFYVFEVDFPKELGFTWEAALQGEFQFLRFPWGRRSVFLALQGEALFTVDKFSIPNMNGTVSEEAFVSLMAPLLLKLNYKPGPFTLSLYGGVYYIWYLSANNAAEDAIRPAMRPGENPGLLDSLGYSAGFKFGVKAGKRGTFFFDLRYSSDIGVTEIGGSAPMSYRRYIPSLSLGYEVGLFNRK
ncbi:MAG: hypothetical protein LBH57_10110 [Treponema sp.]|nr:hypothetical protein [Treponema sp.]